MSLAVKTIRKFNEFFSKHLKSFYSNKYHEEDMAIILADLRDLLRNEFLDKIYFCQYEKDLDNIFGYVFDIDYKSGDIRKRNTNFVIEPAELKDRNEILLILKMSDKFYELEYSDREKKMSELTNLWSYLSNPDIDQKIKNEKNYFVDKGIKITSGEINE